jgi:hypothetical protein
MVDKISPDKIMQIGMGFFASKTLLSAVELGPFTHLGGQSLNRNEIEMKLGLHERSSEDFLDALVSLEILTRSGEGEKAKYSNTEQASTFLDRASPQYIGGILEMASVRLFRHWGDLTEGLKTGKPQNEIKYSKNKEDLFAAIYSDPAKLEIFLAAMAGIQKSNFILLAKKFDFSKHGTVCDVGGASAAFSIAVARQHSTVQCTSFDLTQVQPIALRAVQQADLGSRIKLQNGDFFKDPIPKAKVIAMGNILHDWSLEQKKFLIKKAYEALPAGGCFIAIENIIDDERRKNTFGLMMSLNMLIETDDGFDYTGAQFRSWCLEAGFRTIEILPLLGASSAAIAYK